MGCFLGCFGGSKDCKRRKQRNRVIPRDQQRLGGQNSLQAQNAVSKEEEGIKESPLTNLVSELCDKPEEQLSSNSRKKVTFDSNVTTYEHVSAFESVDSLPECEEVNQKEKEEIVVLSSNSQFTSEVDSVTSSVGSYPPNHRYQNCRDSDDEAEECGDFEDDDYDDEEDYSDYDDNDAVDERIVSQEVWSESVLTESMESRTDNLADRLTLEEVEGPMDMPFLPKQDVKTICPNRHARNRSDYVHPVLNPVENLTQWKTVKSKGTSQLKLQKENFTAELEVPLPFNSEPTFRQSSSSLKPKSEQKKNLNQELAVNASLSSWLVGPESSSGKTSLSSIENTTFEKVVSGMSQGSNSVRSFEDRPILGALTVEELKQLAAASSPRRSPSRSPDAPIIGTVGTYWNDSVSSKDSRSASSYKGIPNTISKYREDKRVNWHSTPFETRLERALNRGAGEV